MLPFEYIRSEALVRKAFHRIRKSILSGLQLDKEDLCIGMVFWRDSLVWVIYGGSGCKKMSASFKR